MLQKALKRLPAYSLTIAVSVIILYLTLAPHPLPDNDLPTFEGIDKVVHFIMFAALAGAIVMDRMRQHDISRASGLLIIIAMTSASVAGGAIELIQGAMDMGRGCEWADFIADIAGSIAGALIAPSVTRKLLQ